MLRQTPVPENQRKDPLEVDSEDLKFCTPISEIKSKLFGNEVDDESDVSDDGDNTLHSRDEFLKYEDGGNFTLAKGRKKCGRKSSTENSDKKQKKKSSKTSKTN